MRGKRLSERTMGCAYLNLLIGWYAGRVHPADAQLTTTCAPASAHSDPTVLWRVAIKGPRRFGRVSEIVS